MGKSVYVSTSLRKTHLGPEMGANRPTMAAVGADESRDGLFRLTIGPRGVDVEDLGLDGLGGLRSPVVVDVSRPERLYASTNRGGIFRSDDRGKSWQEKNQGLIYKETWSLVQHPATGELYVGTGPGAVFKSVDGADTWVECERLRELRSLKDWTFPGPPFLSHVKWLSLHRDDPNRVWGAVEEGWLIRSMDGGQTWDNLKNGSSHDSHSTLMLQDNPDVVISTSGQGVFRSEDNGETFTESNTGLDCTYLAQIANHPSAPHVMFTAGAETSPPSWTKRPEGANGAFYRSDDAGMSWRRLTGGLPAVMTAAPRAVAGDEQDPSAVYVGLNDGSLWWTGDGGEGFEQIVTGLPPVSALAVRND